MPLSGLVSPSDLHRRAEAAVREAETPVDELALYHTVLGFINGSTGHARAQAPFFNIYTTEYTLIPIPSAMLDKEATRVCNALREEGFYVTLKDDSLQRLREECLMVVCWDPRVIAADRAGIGNSQAAIPKGNCILPGKTHLPCTHCYDCVLYFAEQAQKAKESGAADAKAEKEPAKPVHGEDTL